MSLNVRSGIGQVPTFVFIPAVATLALAAISPNVATGRNTAVSVQNVPGLALAKFAAIAQNHRVIQVLNVPGKALAAIIADPNFVTHINATVRNVPLGGTGFVHQVVGVSDRNQFLTGPASFSGNEGTTVNAVVTSSRSFPTNTSIAYVITPLGGAVAGVDYSAPTSPLVLLAGQTSATLAIQLLSDAVADPGKSLGIDWGVVTAS